MAFRIDTIKIDGKPTRTPEGFLRVDAVVTRSGVFRYRSPDGSDRFELRHDSEVFNEDSINTLKMVPMTNNHPAEGLVTCDNAKNLQIGFTGEVVKKVKPFVGLSVVITDASAIADIDAGKRELSCGYHCDVVEEQGEYNGEKYTHKQTGIKYNHVAVVDCARAGRESRLKLDQFRADSAYMIDSNESDKNIDNNIKKPPKGGRPMAIKLINSIGYEAAQEVINRLDTVEKELEETKKALSISQADTVVHKSRADKAETELSAMPAKMAASLASRRKLEADTSSVLPKETKYDSMTDEQIMSAVIAVRFPDIKLDGKDSVYISTIFDAALAVKAASPASINAQLLGGTFIPPTAGNRNDAADDFDPLMI